MTHKEFMMAIKRAYERKGFDVAKAILLKAYCKDGISIQVYAETLKTLEHMYAMERR